jgi:protocatechuate 3,4-dioxygenase beta subunit
MQSKYFKMKYYTPVSFLLVLPILFCAASNSVLQISIDNEKAQGCQELSVGDIGFIQLTKKTEPGESLTVYGKILDKQTSQPIENASLFLYQTDSTGIYNISGIDRDARIKGTVYSNTSGCFKIQTILPGDYPGNKNSRHLHYVINAKGYKELTSALFFKGFTTRNLTEQAPLIILDIKKNNTGAWVGMTNLYLEKN